jgi:hypothetical protein
LTTTDLSTASQILDVMDQGVKIAGKLRWRSADVKGVRYVYWRRRRFAFSPLGEEENQKECSRKIRGWNLLKGNSLGDRWTLILSTDGRIYVNWTQGLSIGTDNIYREGTVRQLDARGYAKIGIPKIRRLLDDLEARHKA